ncbi:3-deoxy-manno-octulosonate cytidylyltransferase [Campylobacter lari]|uniref:3-deoxy-manno-octulosonate cytidylyltransferase n=1 Tax=Campylobacter lari TaxID=201 RepID=UPI00126D6B40|nr:3-deoxy-manno-octulosonate cytidylyltransferase [Campylobacter lari]MBT0819575.1 3-deoxy-manno-octulosonate cytidylyltransferase [Campylobacter lari]MBT0833789.1 3-deoxy-manno-octulosonate cytidylyltransferase [Campylobacter lari]
MKLIGVIPARYHSSRFQGKPLCLISGIPMIKRTFMQVIQASCLSDVYVATDNELIYNYCKNESIPVMMTSVNCLTGTDRIAEISQYIDADLYVNIQGDEPVIDPLAIEEIANEYKLYSNEYIAYNLYKMANKEEAISDTIIKVITNNKDELVYMSRSIIPYEKNNLQMQYKKQVCVYGFTKESLEIFSKFKKTPNEKHEDIELLRFIDLGYKVKMKETKCASIAVDVPSDVVKVEEYLQNAK